MDFDNGKPIYLQIVDLFYENILSKQWPEEQRIPSVREIAMMVEVNPNTAMRSFNYLQELGVIHNKRGIGYFVSEAGYSRVLEIKRTEFREQILPDVIKQMGLLKISLEEVKQVFNQYTTNATHEKE
ncbi:MAG: GntR family transcriptional regulator [Bacteroidota bacterium]